VKKSVVILLADGFEEIEAVTTIDILRRGGVSVVVAGVNSSLPTGAHGIVVKTDALVYAVVADDYDAIILPGGYKGTMTLCEDATAQVLIKDFDRKNKIIAAICAAPIALDMAGVLKDEYTCYPGCSDGIKSSNFIEKTIVESGNVITSRGPATALCFALYLLEKLVGKQVADEVKKATLSREC